MPTAILIVLAAAAGQPAVVGLAGEYARTYSQPVGALGAKVVEISSEELGRPEKLRELDALIVSHFRDGRWPPGAEKAVERYVRAGGKALLEIAAWPPRGLVKAADRVCGWAPSVEIVDAGAALTAGLRVGRRLRYGAWGCGLKLAAGAGVRVLARWDMGTRDTYSHAIADRFAECDVAMIELRAGDGMLWWVGGETAIMDRSLVQRWLAAILPAEKLPLLGLRKEWALDVSAEEKRPARSGQGVAVYYDPEAPAPGMPRGSGRWVVDELRRRGFAVTVVDSERLCRGRWLGRENGVLVLAQGEAFPAEALGELKRFLASGGGVVSCAGVPLRHLLQRQGERWVDLAEWVDPDHLGFSVAKTTRLVAKAFEFDRPIGFTAVMAGSGIRGPARFDGGRAWGVFFAGNGWAPETYVHPLMVSFAWDGTPLGCPATMAVGVGQFRRARWVALGFVGDEHPFAQEALRGRGDMLVSLVRLAQPRNFTVVGDVWPREVLYRPGEAVEVSVAVLGHGWRAVSGRCVLTISERDSGRKVFGDERAFSVAPGQVKELVFRWPAADLKSWAYMVTARVQPALPGMESGIGEFLAMARGVKVSAPAVRLDAGGRPTVGGRSCRLSGANLYTADTRGVGWFFSPPNELRRHIAVDAFDRDLSYMRLAAGNATRTHYFEYVLTPEDLKEPNNHGMRRLDGYLLLHARHGVAAVFAPFTFWPGLPKQWRQYWGKDADPYGDADCLRVEERYYARLAGHCARRGADNILWQLINEPDGRFRVPAGASAVEKQAAARKVAAWARRMSRAIAQAGYQQAGMGQCTAPLSPYWDPHGNLRELAFHDVHHYSPRTVYADQSEGKWSVPFGLNYGWPATVGEYGQPNAGQSLALVFGDWRVPYEQTLHCVLGENALGFLNFYLCNSAAHPYNPEWGMVRPDHIDKPCGRVWRRWNWLSLRLPPEDFLAPRWAIISDHERRLVDDAAVMREVFAAYVALMREGVYARVMSAADLAALVAAGKPVPERAFIVGEEKLGPKAREAVAKARARGMDVAASLAEMVRRCARELPMRLGRHRATFTYIRALRGRRWLVVFVGAPGGPVELQARGHGYRFILPQGRCAALVTTHSGEPELVEACGPVEMDGRRLVDGPKEGYVVAAPRGRSLIEAGAAELFAEDQRAVEASFALPNEVMEREWRFVARGATADATLEQAATLVTGNGVAMSGADEGPTLVFCCADWPGLSAVLGRHGAAVVQWRERKALVVRGAMMDWPWAGLILSERGGRHPTVYLVGLSREGLLAAAAKFSSLRRLGDYVVAPFMEIRSVWPAG